MAIEFRPSCSAGVCTWLDDSHGRHLPQRHGSEDQVQVVYSLIATVFLHFVIRTAIDSYSGSIYIDYESLFLWRQLSGSFMQSHELAKSYTPSISNVQGRYLGLVKTAMPKTVNVHAILQ